MPVTICASCACSPKVEAVLSATAASQARLEEISELHRMHARDGPPWAQYLDQLAREQDVIDQADGRAQTVRGSCCPDWPRTGRPGCPRWPLSQPPLMGVFHLRNRHVAAWCDQPM